MEKVEKSFGQLVRWLPAPENDGAGSMWRAFCDNNDGGAGNGQLHTKDDSKGHERGQVNEGLVTLKGQGTTIVNTGKDGDTTTTTQYEAKFQRAVFEMAFEWFSLTPSRSNDWGLRENPCWPKDIVPNNPGYVLLTSDSWYSTASPKPDPDLRGSYSKAPPESLIESADGKRGQKRPHSPDDNAPNKQQANNPPSKRALQIIEDGLVIRDANVTRRLTEEEMKRNIEIIPCADRTCSKERRTFGNEDRLIFIPGEGPPMMPSTNPDSVPTVLPRTPTGATGVDKRSSASLTLPAMTVTL